MVLVLQGLIHYNYRRREEALCPGDGIGIRTGLRNQVLRVRVSPRAPKFSRSREEESHLAHNQENGGANPSSATSFIPQNPSKVHGLDC